MEKLVLQHPSSNSYTANNALLKIYTKQKVKLDSLGEENIKGHPLSVDLRYGEENSISPSTLVFAATKG